jgi:putative peptidoglycan lipid II flippase
MARSLLRSTGIFSINTFLSRIVGFVRDMLIAHYFGAAGSSDAFFIAFRIPNFMRGLFAEGSFSQAFIPILSEYRSQRSHEEVRLFMDHTLTTLATVLFGVTLIGILLAPLVARLFAPGFDPASVKFALTTSMLRITFPYILFISLAAFSGAVFNTYDKFGVPSFSPIILNLVLIIMTVFVSPHFGTPVYALAWGVFIAGIVQFTFQLPFLYRDNLLPRIKFNFKDPGVRRVIRLMIPAIIGVSMYQIGTLIDTIFASFLKTGSVSWLYYSDRLMNFPLGVFGVAISTVVLPKLSSHFAAKNHHDYSGTLDWALRLLLLIGIPSMVGIIILSGPLLVTLFFGGKFTSFDVMMARQSLMAFALGLQAFMLVKVLSSGYYGRQDIRTPVKISIMAVMINIILNAAFIVPFHHAGLALATSCAAIVNATLLFRGLIKREIYQPRPGWIKYFIQLAIANGLMAIFLLFFSSSIQHWISIRLLWRVGYLSLLMLGALIIYFGALLISGVRASHFR